LPGWRDVIGTLLLIGILGLMATAGHQLAASLVSSAQPRITLSPTALPFYAFRTMTRMLVALLASLLFTFTYATLAAKSRRAEGVLIPLLDVLQSVPILGYLSFTVVFFVSLFPGHMLGLEMAAIFAIFTSQAWNMAFSFYQSLNGPSRPR
jgi:NitT/TauT family transport system permease protein